MTLVAEGAAVTRKAFIRRGIITQLRNWTGSSHPASRRFSRILAGLASLTRRIFEIALCRSNPTPILWFEVPERLLVWR